MSGNIDVGKYLRNGKKSGKKNYTLYLNEESVEYVKKHLKVPLSLLVNDFMEHISKSIKNEKSKKEDKKESDKKTE